MTCKANECRELRCAGVSVYAEYPSLERAVLGPHRIFRDSKVGKTFQVETHMR